MKKPFNIKVKCRVLVVFGLLAMMFIILGYGVSCRSSAPPDDEPVAGNSMLIEGFVFKPAALIVTVGTTVTWRNDDSIPHTVSTRDNLFDSGSLAKGDTYSYTFNQTGTFDIYCRFHPAITGKVIVQ